MTATTSTPSYVRGSIGTNATLAIGGVTTVGTPSTSFTGVGGIQDATGSGIKRNTVSSSDLTSAVDRILGTVLSYGTVTFTVKNTGADTGQAAVVAAAIAGVPYDFEITYKDADASKTVTVALSAIVTQAAGFDLENDKVNTSKIELTIDGAWSATSA